MENASKALIMAGGILIGILVLTLAIYLFINFSHQAEQTYNQIKENQLNQFNNAFVSLEQTNDGGGHITIYDVISIAKKAREYNDSNDLIDGDENYVKVFLGSTLISDRDIDENEFYTLIEADRGEMSQSNNELPQYEYKNTNNNGVKYNEEGRVVEVSFKRK